MNIILHITTKKEWEQALVEGIYLTPSLKSEGFIHCSTFEQVLMIANRFFSNQHDLLILCINRALLKSKLIYEAPVTHLFDAAENLLFPHIHGPLYTNEVVKAVPFPSHADGTFELPQEVQDYKT